VSGRADILVVDDHPDKLIALEAILSDLGQNVVKAGSGKEALRRLLERDFAVVLLDVNMPIMDGFETAALIRRRARSEHTPIIFITGYGDETHVARGYSLGAVDYILTPVVPEVLRAKVSVFVELWRQSARLAQRAAQLQQLTEASLAINAATSVESILQIAADRAREIIRAGHAVAEVRLGPTRTCRATSGVPAGHPGTCTAPLPGRDRQPLGTLELSGRPDGAFTEEDEALLLQLAQMASIAIQNTLYSEERAANELKDEFLATISHELRTPLTSMLIWAGTLRRGTLDAAARARGIEVIERNVKVQARLIDDLLDMSRIVTGKVRLDVRPVELRDVIEAALDSVRPAAEAKSIALGSTCGSTPVPVRGDPDRLQQIVWNLLTNAIKFTPREGRIEVRLERADGDAEITIEDTGVGISPGFLPHIFDRFRQAESGSTRSHGGLGLGLAIVRNLVDLHGGGVRAASPGPGRGATFTVTLPLAGPRKDPPAPQPAASPQPTPPRACEGGDGMPDLEGLRILVVDDEVDACEAIAVALGLAGANARTAGSARDALGLIEAWAPDVLVSDIGLPQDDGYALIRTVRARHAGPGGRIPALALTAYARAEDRARALTAGYQAHLAKPVDLRELVAVVGRLCGRASEQPRAEPDAGMSRPRVFERR